MASTLTVVGEESQEEQAKRPRIWRETPLTPDLLFRARDEAGRAGWFLRLVVSGLYPRRVGPFQTRAQAVAMLEAFIGDIVPEAWCNLQNDLEIHQTVLMEGIPPLQGPATCDRTSRPL